MKLCANCKRELFDFDNVCDRCGSNNLIITSIEEIQKIKKEIKMSNPIKRKNLLKDNKYNIIYHYELNQNSEDFFPPEYGYFSSSSNLQQNPTLQNLNIVEDDIDIKKIVTGVPTVTCPYCKSTDTKKISGLSKAGSVALFGVFALGKTTKQWHCNNCNSDF